MASGDAEEQTNRSAAAGSRLTAADLNAAAEQLEALTRQLEAQRRLAEANFSPKRPDEAELSRRDSSIKKNAALTKRLRAISDESRAQLLADVARLNLTKYVSEAVASLAEAPPARAGDAAAGVEVASALHRSYAEFGPALGPALAKAFGSKLAGEDDRALLKRQRAALRFLGELAAARVVVDPTPLLGIVRDLAICDYKKDREAAVAAASLLGAFAKATAQPLLGAPPEPPPAAAAALARVRGGDAVGGGEGGAAAAADAAAAPEAPAAAAAGPEQEVEEGPDAAAAAERLRAAGAALQAEVDARVLPPESERAQLRRALERAFDSAAAQLVEAHQALAELDRENARALATRGELAEGAGSEYEGQRKSYETLHRAVALLSEALRRPMPELAEDAFTRLGADPAAAAAGDAGRASEGGAPEHVFEDPEVRAFYEDLPDLRAVVPAVLLADAVQPATSGASNAAAATSDGGGQGPSQRQSEAAGDAAGGGAPRQSDGGGGGGGAESGDKEADGDAGAAAGGGSTGGAAAAGAGGGGGSAEDRAAVDAILARLNSCVTRDLADELAVNFCYCNSKGARRRLVRALVDVPRGSLQLLPYWARVAATLSQCYPDVGQGVLSAVEAEFDAQIAARRASAAGLEEPRLRTARYLAELAKFRLAPPPAVLLRLKQLLDDFNGTNIDAACALVEGAGRFFMRLPESRVRMDNLLGVMMRLRNARNLDSRHAAAVDGAYFACRPPDASARRRRRAPLQEYIRYLIFDMLGQGAIVDVLRKLMKLPWAECERYVLKCMLKVVRVRFSHISLIASLAGGLAQYHESLGVALVDCVLEDVRWGLDNPTAGNYQKRLAEMRLLGEMYNYMLMDSKAVFLLLYSLIGHGHEDAAAARRLDPPDDFFRIRMVVAALSTCGMYFKKGAAGRRLDRFLTFFQAYLLAKDPLPLDVEFDVQDLFDLVRPGAKRFGSYQEAAAACEAILAKDAAAVAAGASPGDEDDDDDEEEEDERGGGGGGKGGRGGARGGGEEEAAEAAGGGGEDGGGGDDEDYERGEYGRPAVDDEFEREWQQLMADAAVPPAAAAGAAPAAPAAAAAFAGGRLGAQERGGEGGGGKEEGEGEEGGPRVTFKILMKRGGRVDGSRELQVPASAALAARVLAKQESEAAERSQIKALVLEADKREQQEGPPGGGGGPPCGGRGGRGRGGGGRRYTLYGGRGGGQQAGLHFLPGPDGL